VNELKEKRKIVNGKNQVRKIEKGSFARKGKKPDSLGLDWVWEWGPGGGVGPQVSENS